MILRVTGGTVQMQQKRLKRVIGPHRSELGSARLRAGRNVQVSLFAQCEGGSE